MGKTRSELREIIAHVLYEGYILDKANIEYDVADLIKEELEVENEFVKEIVDGVRSKQPEINKIANTYLVDWEIDRLSKVDKAILSIGIFELKYTDTPSVVSINEAIELSKKYSDEAVTKMINGVLDHIYHEEESIHE